MERRETYIPSLDFEPSRSTQFSLPGQREGNPSNPEFHSDLQENSRLKLSVPRKSRISLTIYRNAKQATTRTHISIPCQNKLLLILLLKNLYGSSVRPSFGEADLLSLHFLPFESHGICTECRIKLKLRSNRNSNI